MDILKPVYKTAIVKTVKSAQGKTFEGDFLSFRRQLKALLMNCGRTFMIRVESVLSEGDSSLWK